MPFARTRRCEIVRPPSPHLRRREAHPGAALDRAPDAPRATGRIVPTTTSQASAGKRASGSSHAAAGRRRLSQESSATTAIMRPVVMSERGTRWCRPAVTGRPATSSPSGITWFAGFYGPDAFQVHDLARAVLRGFATIPGPPEAFLSSISHDDAATACRAALSVPIGVYNVADDEPLTHRAYVDTVAAALGVPSPRLPPRWAGRLMGSIGELLLRSQRISNAKLRRASGWSPRYPSAREGWLATVAQLRTVPALGRVASAHRAG